MPAIKGYYFITDNSLTKHGSINDVKSAVKAGVNIVQYRNKGHNAAKMLKELKIIRKICKNTNLIVNDRIDLSLIVNADGVHLGQEDIPLNYARRMLGRKKIIGITVHNTAEAKKAIKEGADYLGVSPIFQTTTKKDAGRAKGISLIKNIKKFSNIPLAAIGGITLANAGKVIGAGADAVCAISAVVTSNNTEREIKKFQTLFKKT